MSTFLGIPKRHAAQEESPLRGTLPFPKAARKELANDQLRRNLAHATSVIRSKRAQVVDEMPDWEELRDAGAATKTQVMANLPALLEQFEANVTARGGVVHWATDAQEANRIVTELVRAQGVDEVIKVKSMATQEIGLNEYLEDNGIASGVGSALLAACADAGLPVRARRLGIPTEFLAHATRAELLEQLGLTSQGCADAARAVLTG